MFWFVVVFALALVASYVLMPKPESRPPAGLGDFNVPTAEVGREIPVLFGTRKLSGPNVVWYGHLRVVPIKKKGGKK
jgi:hypothetical protein